MAVNRRLLHFAKDERAYIASKRFLLPQGGCLGYFHGSMPVVGITAGLACVIAIAPVSGPLLFRKARIGSADISNETPMKTSPV